MSRRILIVPDKFKGSLSGDEAAGAIARGWAAACPNDRLVLLPMSDGGDGFGPVMAKALGLKERLIDGIDAAGQARQVALWLDAESGQAVVETAQSNGLALLPGGRFHPFDLDTRGVGSLLLAAGQAGATRCLAGVGGSATNDGGFGLARSLGWMFWDESGSAIEHWTELEELVAIERPASRFWPSVTVASDVQNPLLGVEGATRVYGPQKGMRPEDFAKADACLGRLAKIAGETLGRDFSVNSGAGAAGGLGFGLMAFAGASIEPGFEVFADATGLEEKIAETDFVVTAEGSIDEQTLMGKGTGQIAALCRELGKPCIGLAGQLALGRPVVDPGLHLFWRLGAIVPELASEPQSMAKAAIYLEQLAKREALLCNSAEG
ncbi:MAG: glycerate kinase [Verrucomicrobiota bacterium]|nr:glycerate kinase [Verrucomicrobiota bacterium]